MAQAVLALFPGAQYAIAPSIEEGFYYDFAVGRAFTPEDLEAVEARMAEIVAADQPFERETVSKEAALQVFAAQPFKREIIESVEESEGPQASRSPSIGTGTSWTCAGGPTCPRRGSWPPTNCCAPPAPTGGATSIGPNCSASTGRPGRAGRRSMTT